MSAMESTASPAEWPPPLLPTTARSAAIVEAHSPLNLGLDEEEVVWAGESVGLGFGLLSNGKVGLEAVNWDCRLCCKTASDPCVTRCGHLFCWKHLQEYLSPTASGSCPVCSSPISMERDVVQVFGRPKSIPVDAPWTSTAESPAPGNTIPEPIPAATPTHPHSASALQVQFFDPKTQGSTPQAQWAAERRESVDPALFAPPPSSPNDLAKSPSWIRNFPRSRGSYIDEPASSSSNRKRSRGNSSKLGLPPINIGSTSGSSSYEDVYNGPLQRLQPIFDQSSITRSSSSKDRAASTTTSSSLKSPQTSLSGTGDSPKLRTRAFQPGYTLKGSLASKSPRDSSSDTESDTFYLNSPRDQSPVLKRAPYVSTRSGETRPSRTPSRKTFRNMDTDYSYTPPGESSSAWSMDRRLRRRKTTVDDTLTATEETSSTDPLGRALSIFALALLLMILLK